MAYGQRAWGEAEEQTLRKLWAEGHSASQISRVLGNRSRNSVIGRVHRQGLSGRSRQNDHKSMGARIVARRKSQVKHIAPKPKPATLPAEPQDLPPILGVLLHQLNDMTCRYPIGDPMEPGFSYCGRTCFGGSYCVGHARLCYTPVNQRQARATERLANWLDRRTFKQATA